MGLEPEGTGSADRWKYAVTTPETPFQIIISNGFSRYNLADAAAALAGRGRLALFLTGAYPAGWPWSLIRLLRLPRRDRLAARGVDIPVSRVSPLWLAEMVQAAGMALRRRGAALRSVGNWLDVAGYRLYGWLATGIIGRVPLPVPTLYHYRAGFGQGSVLRARSRGMAILCEHTIAHPRLVDYLVAHRGVFPPAGARPAPNRFWRNILDDLERADHVVVNSDFVRRTFLHQGWPEDRVHVVHIGVDQPFIDMLPPRPPAPDGPVRLLFAGGLEPRKGAAFLIEALSHLDDLSWRLDIVGGINPDIVRRFATFLADPRVRIHGLLPRSGVAARMAAADIFIFPSLAEGSARVVFEALAAGCFVVTTPNSGSIVEEGRHGLLVPPGDAVALREALRRAITMDGDARAAIGAASAALIRRDYNQRLYGERLAALYERLRPPMRPAVPPC